MGTIHTEPKISYLYNFVVIFIWCNNLLKLKYLVQVKDFYVNFDLDSYAIIVHLICSTVIFMLPVSSYTFSEILSSNVTAGIPVLPWWTGKSDTITICTTSKKRKKTITINRERSSNRIARFLQSLKLYRCSRFWLQLPSRKTLAPFSLTLWFCK